MKKPRIYFAAPLFTQAEWCWNLSLAARLEELGMQVLLPQKLARPMLNGRLTFDSKRLFKSNIEGIRSADAILAVLDQADPDSGTSWECGYAYAIGRPILGLRTDLRQSTEGGREPVNLMLVRSCTSFIMIPPRKRTDVHWVARQIRNAIRKGARKKGAGAAESDKERNASPALR